MVKLIIESRKERLITADGVQMIVHPVYVQETNGDQVVLQDYHGECVTDVSVHLLRYHLARWIPWMNRVLKFEMPERLRKGIVSYFRRYHAQQSPHFDCYGFVCLVHEVDPLAVDRESWLRKGSHIFRWERKTGDLVFLMNLKEELFHHAAIYIGKGLYLSVYGVGGDLEVATLRDMRRGYKAKDVCHLRVSEN